MQGAGEAKAQRGASSLCILVDDSAAAPLGGMGEFLEQALAVWAQIPEASEQACFQAITKTNGDIEAAVSLLNKEKEEAAAAVRGPPKPQPAATPLDVSDPSPRAPVQQRAQQPRSVVAASPRQTQHTSLSAVPTEMRMLKTHNAAVKAASALPYVVHAARTQSKYRLLATVPVLAQKELDSKLICELDEGTVCEIAEEVAVGGHTRVRIVDPVWNGWITRRHQSGAVVLEPIVKKSPQMIINGIKMPPPAPKPETGERDGSGEGGDAPATAAAAAAAEAHKPLSESEKRERDDGRWKEGILVLLTGCTTMREYNGRSGVLMGWKPDIGRYEVRLPTRVVRARPAQLDMHPTQRKREQSTKGDEVVFLTTDEQAARDGVYAVKLDPQYWFDQAINRVFDAENEYEVRAPLLPSPPSLPRARSR